MTPFLTLKETALVRLALGNMERSILKRSEKVKSKHKAAILALVAEDVKQLKDRFK
jgi:hypothetical protein